MNAEVFKPGFALQLFRQIRGYSRRRLAAACDLSIAELRRAEHGEADLGIQDLHNAVTALNFSLADMELLFLVCDLLARGNHARMRIVGAADA